MTLIPEELRESVLRRAGNRCEYCHLLQASQVATFPVDHIVPVVLCILEARTATGRATIALLDLNSPRCVAIRRWLAAIGLHPAD